jgi:hypothetical protein
MGHTPWIPGLAGPGPVLPDVCSRAPIPSPPTRAAYSPSRATVQTVHPGPGAIAETGWSNMNTQTSGLIVNVAISKQPVTAMASCSGVALQKVLECYSFGVKFGLSDI